MSEIATELNTSVETIGRDLKRGQELGLVADARDRLMALLPQTELVYTRILTTSPEDLHKHSRGHKLQLDTVNALNEGLGTFKRETMKTTKSVLETIASEHGAPTSDSWGRPDSADRQREQRRIAYVAPDAIEVEALPEREGL